MNFKISTISFSHLFTSLNMFFSQNNFKSMLQHSCYWFQKQCFNIVVDVGFAISDKILIKSKNLSSFQIFLISISIKTKILNPMEWDCHRFPMECDVLQSRPIRAFRIGDVPRHVNCNTKTMAGPGFAILSHTTRYGVYTAPYRPIAIRFTYKKQSRMPDRWKK